MVFSKLQLTKTTPLDSKLLPSGINACAPIGGLNPTYPLHASSTPFLFVIVTSLSFVKVSYQVVAMVSSGASIHFDKAL